MNLGPLETLPQYDRDQLAYDAKLEEWAAGQFVYVGGAPSDRLYIVQSGIVAIEISLPGGEQALLTLLGPGAMFGELALAGVARRTAGVRALEPAVTASIPVIAMIDERAASPAIDELVMEIMANTIRRLSGQLVEARHLPYAARLRRLLHQVAPLYAPGPIRLDERQLAQLAGCRPEAAAQFLADNAASGLIRLGPGGVEVLDDAALARAAH